MAVYEKDDVGLFRRAVGSVLTNSLQPDEFILVQDGPVPPALAAEITTSERCGVNVLRLRTNVGLAAALNVGIASVKTAWIARADADDVNLPHRFSVQASHIRSKSVRLDVLGSEILEVDASDRPVAIRTVPTNHDGIRRYLKFRNPINHMTAVYRTALAREVGGYPSIYLKEDYAFWAKLIWAGALFENLPTVLVHARAGKDMYRRRGGWLYTKSEWQLRRLLVELGLQSPVSGALIGAIRAGVFLMPNSWRGLVYEKLLRGKVLHSN